MSLRVVVEPSFEPVTLAEAKLWCKLEDDDVEQDAIVLLLIKAMREYAENLTGRHFVQRTMELGLPCFPACRVIELSYAPVRSVTSIQYLDLATETWLTIEGSPTGWMEDLSSEPARIAPLYQESWPDVLVAGAFEPVRVRYVTGYPNPNAIPKSVKLWMAARIGTLFDQRSQIITGTIVAELPRAYVDGLLDSLVIGKRLF